MFKIELTSGYTHVSITHARCGTFSFPNTAILCSSVVSVLQPLGACYVFSPYSFAFSRMWYKMGSYGKKTKHQQHRKILFTSYLTFHCEFVSYPLHFWLQKCWLLLTGGGCRDPTCVGMQGSLPVCFPGPQQCSTKPLFPHLHLREFCDICVPHALLFTYMFP